MAESFVNSVTRAAGIVTTSTAGAIGITTNLITGISTVSVTVGDLIQNTNYIAGTKVASVVSTSSVTADRDSTNTTAVSSQTVKYLGLTTAYTSASGTKSIIIGGTFANNTTSEVELTVHLYDDSADLTPAIISKVPVPNGSSFVLSDTGKTVLEGLDAIRVYCDTANGVDVQLGILKGVS